MAELPVFFLRHLDLSFAPRRWAFAQENEAGIAAHFAARRRAAPDLWNGRVLLLHTFSISAGVLRGSFFATDFAAFLAWRDWGFPDRSVTNCFAMGALRASDGAFLLAVMGAHTANAGRIYFPAGTPDPDDVSGDRVDLEANVAREMAEETGLAADAYAAEPGWHAVCAGSRLALMRVLQARETAEDLRQRILRHLRADPNPELADVRVVRSPGDIEPMMPDFVVAFLRRQWRAQRGA